jgi:hypothetical protein
MEINRQLRVLHIEKSLISYGSLCEIREAAMDWIYGYDQGDTESIQNYCWDRLQSVDIQM